MWDENVCTKMFTTSVIYANVLKNQKHFKQKIGLVIVKIHVIRLWWKIIQGLNVACNKFEM